MDLGDRMKCKVSHKEYRANCSLKWGKYEAKCSIPPDEASSLRAPRK